MPRNRSVSFTKKIAEWEKEHKKLLEEIAPEEFDVLHYAAIVELSAQK